VGVDVRLETGWGEVLEEVGDESGFLARILPEYEDRSFCLLRYIDRYGHTVFNELQMPDFLEEWRRLYRRAVTDEDREVLARVEELARRICETQLNYLRFLGD
jgi:hypothetical protein